MYQTVMMDLDGTTLTPENTVPEELNNYLKKLRARGVHVFVVTGRTLGRISNILPADFPAEGIVTTNGMAVYAGGRMIYRNALPEKLVLELLHHARSHKIYYQMDTSEDSFALLRDKPYFVEQISGQRPESVSKNEWLSRKQAIAGDLVWKETMSREELADVNKIYFFSSIPEKIENWKERLNQLRTKIPFDCFSSSHSNVEASGKGVSKATGIRILLNHFHLSPEKAVVFGDGENDLPMFRIAGHSVAMQNAPDAIKQQADEVTRYSHAENGLYHFLKQTFE
ncbi:Cof-type HAD-IIB family hydrolase [Sporolactobacillus vineae]|uniref:Cof-type HAD-IIB family hydrolase n=1 Tax=Sporolactobacillus vineae TaxID=444463 RepID=UPI00028A373A|nr:Cof-type HAD-IIB family hydrolase [Sporolactobacillus vineae]